MTDFEHRAPILQATTVLALAVLLTRSFWSAKPFELPTATVPITSHPAKTVPPPSLRTPEPPSRPENLRGRFLEPRTLELQWDSLGEAYVYRVYAAASSALQNAQPLTEKSIQASYMTWTPDDGIQTIWVAVKGIDELGRQTPFSRPLLVRLP